METPAKNDRIEHRLRQSAELDGDRIAFDCRDDALSYHDLLQRSNSLAGMLQERGVGPGARVGIVMFKSIDMPVAVYGILGAGCVYVPVDPLASSARLAQIVADCDIRCLICDRYSLKKVKDVAAAHDVMVVGDDDCRDACVEECVPSFSWSDAKRASLIPSVEPASSSAYIIYTSGSTGVPKGIEHTHESALSYVDACVNTWQFTSDDRFANHSPLHFDMATMEFLVAPSLGARTVLIPDDAMKMPASMVNLIEEHQITVWYSVPFALVQLVDSGLLHDRDFLSLRKVIFAGEVFPLAKLRQLRDLLPGVDLSNAYGPTETNVCTVFHVDEPSLTAARSIPIGKPWGSSAIRIENKTGNLVESDEIGELLVAGGTVMKGYWNRPELNASAFVQRGDGQRYYRTGDLVYEDADGVIHLCGRKDRQIKHRGYRIELDEIESVLHTHPAVSHAAALIHPDRDEIVAVVALSEQSSETLKSLRKLMRDRLPSYAVPSALLPCSEIPISANNKIDHVTLAKKLDQVERDHNTQIEATVTS